MGLKENRFTKTFQDEQFPELKAQIIEAAGFDVAFNIEWDTLFENRLTSASKIPKPLVSPSSV